VHRDGHVLVAGGKNHWTKLPQMKLWRSAVVRPVVRRAAEEQGLEGTALKEAMGLVNIDAYSVHRSAEFAEEFCSWPLSEEELSAAAEIGQPLSVEYVPARCTGLYQTADVAINRPFKVRMQSLYTESLIGQLREELQQGVPLDDIDMGHDGVQELATNVLSWALNALQHCRERVNMQATLQSLGYAGCFTNAQLRNAGVRRLTAGAGEMMPAEDEPQRDDADYVDMGAADDDSVQKQFYAEE
jgi:hypothetical protein